MASAHVLAYTSAVNAQAAADRFVIADIPAPESLPLIRFVDCIQRGLRIRPKRLRLLNAVENISSVECFDCAIVLIYSV